jgi:ribonuclease HII
VSAAPTLRTERALIRESGVRLIAGVDEVGRGALSGPVTVGAVLICETTGTAPKGVRDSKLLAPAVRERLAPRLRRWGLGHGVGHATAAEIDAVGIMAALRLAALRALQQLPEVPDLVILDGNHDYINTGIGTRGDARHGIPDAPGPPVRTLVKADLTCASVAAASVLAKTERDGLMIDLAREHPAYLWELNKGYASPQHLEALREHGPCVQHRRSWRLPGWAHVG